MPDRPARPRALRRHKLVTTHGLETLAAIHHGHIERGAGWRTLDLGKGRRYCAVDDECAMSEVCS